MKRMEFRFVDGFRMFRDPRARRVTTILTLRTMQKMFLLRPATWFFLLLGMLSACESPRPGPSAGVVREAPGARAEANPSPQEEAVRFEGQGMRNTKAFYLSGGDYAIISTVTPEPGHGCGNLSSLVGIGQPSTDFLAQSDVRKPFTDTNLVYSKRPGRYYMAMSSGCRWVVTIQRQP